MEVPTTSGNAYPLLTVKHSNTFYCFCFYQRSQYQKEEKQIWWRKLKYLSCFCCYQWSQYHKDEKKIWQRSLCKKRAPKCKWLKHNLNEDTSVITNTASGISPQGLGKYTEHSKWLCPVLVKFNNYWMMSALSKTSTFHWSNRIKSDLSFKEELLSCASSRCGQLT